LAHDLGVDHLLRGERLAELDLAALVDASAVARELRLRQPCLDRLLRHHPEAGHAGQQRGKDVVERASLRSFDHLRVDREQRDDRPRLRASDLLRALARFFLTRRALLAFGGRRG
jgi:hypothetical protein